MLAMRRILPALVAALVPVTCLAGGSVGLDEVDRLLDRTPHIKQALLGSLQPTGSAYAEVRLGPQFKNLGGHRLGPYSFQARPKGKGGGGVIYVTLCTTYRFVDRLGKPLPQGSDGEFDATQVREQVTAIVLRETEGNPSENCP